MRKFTDVLDEYLEERERQNSDYYDGRWIELRTKGRFHLEDLAQELNKFFQEVEE